MNVKSKLLKYLPDFIQDSGYLLPDITIPLHSCGNCNEFSGQLLCVISDMKEAEQIIGGLAKNEVVDGLIPRTVYYGENEPLERIPNRWERYKDVWWRTDCSHSQFFYLAMGLWSCRKNKCAEGLLKRMLIRLFDNKFIIKTIYGNDADEGRFYPLGNAGLRMLALYQMGRKLGLSPKLKGLNKFFLKLNLQLMSQDKYVRYDSWNTYQCLKTLAEIDMNYYKYLENWLVNNINYLPKIDIDNIDYHKNIEDAIIFLNLPLIKR